MERTTVFSSRIIKNSLSYLRNKDTELPDFRKHADIISIGVGYQLAEIILPPLITRQIETPLMETSANFTDSSKFLFVAILRSGYPLCRGIQTSFPDSKLALVDIKRDEKTAKPKLNYNGLPSNLDQYKIIIPDPMLATGGSLSMAISELKMRGAKDITAGCIISAPEGIEHINQDHPDVNIFTCAIDEGLNKVFYIYPGLGDFGDRYYGNTSPSFYDEINQRTLKYQPDGIFYTLPGKI